ICGPEGEPVRVVKIAGHDPCTEAKTACSFDEENSKIPTRSPAPIQCLGRRLRALVISTLILDPRCDAGAQILQEAQRIRWRAPDECTGPVPQPPCRICVLWDRQGP